MDEATRKILESNPFYKMSSKQKQSLVPEKPAMQPFGDLQTHDNAPGIQKVKVKRNKNGDKN